MALAYALSWQTKDLVWSLWLSSLAVGYLTLLAAIAGGARYGMFLLRHSNFQARYRLPAILGGIVVGCFILGFFSLHFCGFHAGHSVFLQLFFPIDGVPEEGFGRAFMNPPLLWIFAFRHLLEPYGLFLLPALIAERSHVFEPIRRAIRDVRTAKESVQRGEAPAALIGAEASASMKNFIGRPYLNVMRMHFLIFFFAFAHLLKVDSFTTFAIVYSLYFFPWQEARKAVGRGRAAAVPAV